MFNKNLQALKIRNPQLAKQLSEFSLQAACKTVSAGQNANGEFFIFHNNIPLDNPKQPFEAAKQLWETQIKSDLHDTDFVFVFGLGLGYLFKRAFVSTGARIIVYDPMIEVLRFVLEYVDLSVEIQQNRILLTNSKEDVLNFLNEKFLKQDKIEILINSCYQLHFKDELNKILDLIFETCQMKIVDINTSENYSRLWAINTINNLKTRNDYVPLSLLAGKFEGKTALIASAGASLAKDIDVIKQNRNKFTLFAINQSLDFLLKNEIEPDFVIMFDGRGIGTKLKNKLPAQLNTNVIMSLSADKFCSTINAKNFFLIFNSNETFSLNLQKTAPDLIELSPASVNTSGVAYHCAKLLGFKNIIFSGLDLAFKGNKFYADGRILEIKDGKIFVPEAAPISVVEVPAVNGQMVFSREDYIMFAKQLSNEVKNDTDFNVYNSSTFGVFIDGMIYSTLEEILQNTMPQAPFEMPVFKIEKFNEILKNKLLEIEEDFAELSVLISEESLTVPKLLQRILDNPYLALFCETEILKLINKLKSQQKEVDLTELKKILGEAENKLFEINKANKI